jgi:acetylornithine deacetylase/succinyl-diaminopimelate desuccinylase-like protein
MATWREHLDANDGRYLDDLIALLRIPSVSALPAHDADVKRAAEWVAARLERAGMEHARVLSTARHPVVYADWLHAHGQPTVLLYAHLDVQPVDPLDQWRTPPFEPVVRDDNLFARGAADMKSGLLAQIVSLEALLQTTGRLPVNVKVFVEAEEEIGSPSAPAFLEANKELFACDLVVSGDGQQIDEVRPVARIAWRGLTFVQIDVRGANTDLHSGHYGGTAPNAPMALAQILASMKAPDGRVLVEGFYDDVRPLTDRLRTEVAEAADDEARVRERIGLVDLIGEPGFTPGERVAVRPTLEVNGMWGGFQGEGSKTVIPCEAHAKITCRLVPDQDPDHVAALLQAHVAAHTPPGVTATVQLSRGGARPYEVPSDHPGNRAIAAVLTELYGRPPVYIRNGGTLPVTGLFLNTLGAYTVALCFGLPDQRVHAPNEFHRLSSFRRAQRAHALFLEKLATG